MVINWSSRTAAKVPAEEWASIKGGPALPARVKATVDAAEVKQ